MEVEDNHRRLMSDPTTSESLATSMHSITKEGMDKLINIMVEAKNIDKLYQA